MMNFKCDGIQSLLRLFLLLPVALLTVTSVFAPSALVFHLPLSLASAARADRRLWPAFDPCRRFALEHAKNKEQTVASYMHVCLELIYAKSPLVFGLGRDSAAYLAVNNATVFVEDNLDWIASANLPCAASCVVPYNYSTTIRADGVVLDDAHVPPIDAPALRGRRFDFILVDAPHGHSPGQPGRYQPLKFAAAQLAADALEYVCLHDFNRELEKLLFERYFGVPDDIVSNGAFGQQLGCKRFKVPRFRN
jgi:hypothetical protein